MQSDRKIRGITLFSLVVGFLVLSGSAVLGTGLQLRQKEPVILLGQNMPRFIGALVGDIRVYRYSAAANSFLPVPCQVDERDYKLDYFSAGAQNGLLDSNDEIVFMAQDLGDEAPSDQIWPDDLDSKQHRRYQVAVTDPVTAERGFIYIFVSQTLAKSPDYYISYQNNSVFGRSYRAGHNPEVASGLPDTLIIPVAAGGDGLNFISRLRFRIYSDFSGGTILKDKVQLRLTEKCSRNYPLNTNLGINGRLYGEVGPNNVIVRIGPVRILRSPSLRVHLWGGVNNIGEFDNTFSVPIGFRYYPDFFEVPTNKVTVPLTSLKSTLSTFGVTARESRIIFSMVLNERGQGMRYYTPRLPLPADQQAGYKLDGIDEGYPQTIWSLVPGEWPGQHWYAEVSDINQPASLAQNTTLFTLAQLFGTPPMETRDLLMWENYADIDGLVNWGDAGLQVWQRTGLPNEIPLDINLRYYPLAQVLYYNDLQTMFNIFSVPMTTESVEQKNDYTPPGNITDLQIAGLDDNQIVLSWTAVGDDGVTGQAAYYLVRYNTQPPQSDLGEWWAQAQPFTGTTPPKTPGSPDTLRLTGLQPNQNYYIGIRVVDEADNASSLMLVTSVTTPVELSSFTAKVDKDRVFLDWKTASETNNLGFAVERRGSGEKSWQQIAFITGAGTTQKTNSYICEDAPGGIGGYFYRLRQCDTNGLFTYLPEIRVEISAPQTFSLAQNFPNPFNPSTSIHFQIPANGGDRIALVIYDLLGRQVRTLYDGNAQAGFYRMEWDGKDDLGRPAGTGVYFYILRSESGQITRKMIKVQ